MIRCAVNRGCIVPERENGCCVSTPEPILPRGIRGTQLAIGGLAFLLITIASFCYQFSEIETGDAAPALTGLCWVYLPLIIFSLPLETLLSSLRTWIIGGTLQPGITFWTCIKAEWANIAMSMLTPSQSGGGVGQIYILTRGGASLGTALAISLLSFFGTVVGLFCLGAYSLLVSRVGATSPAFVIVVWVLISIGITIVLAAVLPTPFRIGVGAVSRAVLRLQGRQNLLCDWWPPEQEILSSPVDRMDRLSGKLVTAIYSYRDAVYRFLDVGKMRFVSVCLLSLAFLLARALLPCLWIRFLGIEASSLTHLLNIQIALIFLVFFAPTPGAAGFAESASLSILTGIVSAGFAPYYNFLWRFSTLFLPAIAGVVCLFITIMKDARTILHQSGTSSVLK